MENVKGLSDQSVSSQVVSSKMVSDVINNKKDLEWWCVDLGQAVEYSPLKLEELAEGFLRFTPDVIMGKNRIFLEMSRTKKLFRLDSVQKRAAVIASRASVDPKFWQWGIGKTIPESWVQCRWKNLYTKLLPIESMFDYIDPFSHFLITRAHQEKINLFLALGMRNLEDLFRVPHDSLLVRFGEMLDQFSKHYFDGARVAWMRFKPHVDLIETTKWNADEWVVDSESLIFAIKPLVEHLMIRLYSQRKSLKVLEIKMELDSTSPDRMFTLSFAFPQTSSQLLLKLLREKISHEMQKDPLHDPIMKVTMKVIEASERDQRSLSFAFSEGNGEFAEDLRERWMELISYLGTAFQVETTEHPLPEKSWRKIQVANPSMEPKLDQVSHLFAKRPFKLFSIPIMLSRVGTFLKKNDELWRIREFACEEKIAGHDWDVENSGGFDRTYYRVKVESSSSRGDEHQEEEWWIYKDELRHKLMLHGVYCQTA
jgi:hypothetical protein